MQDSAPQEAAVSVDSRRAEAGKSSVERQQAYVEEVLEVVELIPAGRVTSYGRIAAVVGRGGPRQVGQVMAAFGEEVPWWRVVRADGSLPMAKQRRARPHYLQEGTPMRTTMAVDIRQALWDPSVELEPES